MFEITVEKTFAAGHFLRGYHGKCENPHGHNYRVKLTLRGERLDKVGLLYDFSAMKAILREIAARLDHQMMNDVPPFDELNPSAENMALYFYQETERRLRERQPENGARVASVTVWETETTTATYTPEAD
jgi:6-pyruvoyltetrahydropterin/6-carboxytetrahydropterin synthase